MRDPVVHLAELNIARARHDLDDPRMKGFVDRLDSVNAVAERSKGFVWRLKDEDGTTIALDDDPRLIVNLSVWETAEDLENFVWNTIHKQVYRRKAEWFPPLGRAHFVMWHVEAGTIPSVEEAVSRLHHLNEHGSSDHAFGWEGLPQLKAWMEMRCA